ncbi:PAAR domain-containing protein [Acinetobacter variabilis]|uniref:PAAR domain-containing protein n=1 Tax=Acinetobacter variabilis TaxID=70346 RepID=UPI00376F9306
MSKALITIGAKTSHGGMVTECENSFLINGMAVHLNGMKHYCLKCQTTVTAIASDLSTIVKGRAVIIAGDKASCGATFLPMQNLTISKK